MEFLQKVKVNRFAENVKKYGPCPWGSGTWKSHYRKVETKENKKKDTEFVVIGTTCLNEGYSEWLGGDDGNGFKMMGRIKVYIVASGLGRRYKVLPEDMEVVRQEEEKR